MTATFYPCKNCLVLNNCQKPCDRLNDLFDIIDNLEQHTYEHLKQNKCPLCSNSVIFESLDDMIFCSVCTFTYGFNQFNMSAKRYIKG